MFTRAIAEYTELHLLEAQHALEMFRLLQDNREHLDHWLRWSGKIKSVDDARALIQRFAQKYAENNGFHAGIWQENCLVGGLVCHYVDWEHRKSEIGYWLAEDALGRGLATQAARAALDYLFGQLELNRVEIQCAVDNSASRAIPERLGFTQEGILRQSHWITNRYVDHVVYALLAEDWRAKNGGHTYRS